jgi:hypothetical protein
MMTARNRNLMPQQWGPEQLDGLVEDLESWADNRDRVNRRKGRTGRPLDSTPLLDAAAALRVLQEYQALYPEFFRWAERVREVSK